MTCCIDPTMQIIQALKRSALAKGAPGITMWRLCTTDIAHRLTVQPSTGAMLASIVQQQAPRRLCKVGLQDIL